MLWMEKGFFQKKENVNLQEASQVVSSYGYNNNFAWFVSSFSGASGEFWEKRSSPRSAPWSAVGMEAKAD